MISPGFECEKTKIDTTFFAKIRDGYSVPFVRSTGGNTKGCNGRHSRVLQTALLTRVAEKVQGDKDGSVESFKGR